MSPEQAAKYLFELITSVPDGVVTVSVQRSSMTQSCIIRVQKQHFGQWRADPPEFFAADDFAAALDKAAES